MKFEKAPIPGKGLGLKATQDIRKGELVFNEKHVGRSINDVLLGQGVQPGAVMHDRLTLTNYLTREISAKDKPAVMRLYDPNPEGPADEKLVRIYTSNLFADGLFLTCSRMNHSCKPAVQMSSDDKINTEVRALRDITAGEEITVSYIRASDLGTKAERAEKLRSRAGGFECDCEICSLTEEEQQRNDQLRTQVKQVMQEAKDFLDEIFGPASTAFSSLRLRQLYLSVYKSLQIVHGKEGQLKGEAGSAVLTILLDLAVLTKVANTPMWRTDLPQAQAMPGNYLDKAKINARKLGTMFVMNCTGRWEMEMDRMVAKLPFRV